MSLLVCLDSTRNAAMSHFFAHALKVRPAGASAIQVRPLCLPYVQSPLFPPLALYSPSSPCTCYTVYTKMLRVHVIEASSLALKATATAKTPLFRAKKEQRSPVVLELSRVILSFKHKWNCYTQYSLCSRRHCHKSFGIYPFHLFCSRSS